jgi:hypothetical protein
MTKFINTAAAKKGTASEKASKALALHDRASQSKHLDTAHSSIAPLKAKADVVTEIEKKKESAKKAWQAQVKAGRNAIKELNDGVDTYSAYVEGVAKGNEEIINDSGLSIRPKAEVVNALDMVMGIVVENGQESGHLLISFDKVKQANHYEILSSTTPGDKETYRIVKTISYIKEVDVNSFKRGETVGIKVRAVGRKGIESPLQQEAVTKFVI